MSHDLFAAPPTGYVRVALPVSVDSLFDYAVPAALGDEAEPGRRVRVPFDRRRLTGLVVERIAEPAPAARARLRSLESILDRQPVLSATTIAILREEAERVLCPVGVALFTALPPGSAPRGVEVADLTPRGLAALSSGAVRGPARALLEALAAGPRPLRSLQRAEGPIPELLPQLEKDGLVTRRHHPRAGARPRRERILRAAPGLELARVLGELRRAPKQAAVLARISEDGPLAAATLEAWLPGASRAIPPLVRRGFVRVTEQLATRVSEGGLAEPGGRVELTPEQREALDAIVAAVRAGRSERFLLHGVTGSGKTEVYLRAVAEALALDRQALVLVPEITLTHQIVGRLRSRFGDRVAVLHSGLRRAERLAQWELLRCGAKPVAVGARSALFAPLEKLGVIVIDEEHDAAYKNEEGFRYHARVLAARRADAQGCPLLLGSATPALETRYAAECGEMRRLVLPHRIAGRPLPAVELVDLERERAHAPRGRKLLLSAALRRALRRTLAEGGQTILFLNRRGFSTQVLCLDCGGVERCKHCDIALVYHAEEQRLRCHYCDYRIAPPAACAACGSGDTALLGVGTERLAEEVRSLFPEARVARLDRDTTQRRGNAQAVLRQLAEGRVDVLVGTQMVAKGHDFPGVRLVGVVNADLGLHFPDFRAAERTFQLLTQVAGRAGRGSVPGRVIVQTFVPNHYAIRPVLDHDYETFYAEELAHRSALGYPPLGQLAQALCSGPNQALTAEAADRLAARTRTTRWCREGLVELLGPAPAPIARLRRRYRFQILLKGRDLDPVRAAARALQREASSLERGIRVGIDVQPLHML